MPSHTQEVQPWVAPLTGSVDRNAFCRAVLWRRRRVAPLTGSVDRNYTTCPPAASTLASLPSRGAWIEMPLLMRLSCWKKVAPLTGSVDRNPTLPAATQYVTESLPSRGAWIEIPRGRAAARTERVAPLTGSVDRNTDLKAVAFSGSCRSPHGERG